MATNAVSEAAAEKVKVFDVPMEDAVRQKLESSKELNIAIVGRYNIGKSTLINAMFKNAVKAPVAKEKAPCTQNAKAYSLIPEDTDVMVTIQDSRGLQDGEGDDRTYLKDIKKACLNIHLVIYCTKLGEPIRPEEEKALLNLATIFGEHILKNAIIALTFANQIEPPDPDTDEVEYFKNEVKAKKRALDECFNKLDIQEQFKGFTSRTFAVGSVRKQKLPTGRSWLPELWMGCLDYCDVEAKPAVVKIGWLHLLAYLDIPLFINPIRLAQLKDEMQVLLENIQKKMFEWK